MAETTIAPAPAQQSWLDTVGNWVTKAGNIFGAVTDVYVAADQRVKALESINEDTDAEQNKLVAVSKAAESAPKQVQFAILLGVAAIALIIGNMIARKTR